MKSADQFSAFISPKARCRACEGLLKAATKVAPAVRRMLSSARSRAKAKGVPFNLTADDIIIPEFCPALHVRLEHGDKDAAPSLDRIIPSKGYVRGNVIVLSNRANRIKNDATAEELHDLAEFLIAVSRGQQAPRRKTPCSPQRPKRSELATDT